MARKKSFHIDNPVLLGIGELADSAGVQAYVVGGYVRDRIMKTESKDIDVMVIGDSIAFSRAFDYLDKIIFSVLSVSCAE